MSADAPRFSHAAQQGERGIHLVSGLFFETFGWIFKRNHQEHDFGIDGQVEVVTSDGELTGQLLAVQIKYGKSFFQEKNQRGYVYRGESKHLNYLANYPIPVLIILCHPDSKKCYWARFEPEETQAAGANWKLTIPSENDLSISKDRIEELLPPVHDHKAALEEYWGFNNLLVESGYIHFISEKPEVLTNDTTRVRSFFDRLRASKALALECQGKVEMSIHGYDTDPRELYEIPEVRKYVATLEAALPELFYFVRSEEPTSTLKTFALCQTNVSFPYGRSTQHVTRQVVFDTDKVGAFLMRGFEGLNEITEWLSLPLEENKRICYSVIRCLGFRQEDIEREA